MAVDEASKRRRGTYVGAAMIVLGLITAVVGYFNDSDSFDIGRMMNATSFAILNAALWTIAGIGVIVQRHSHWARISA